MRGRVGKPCGGGRLLYDGGVSKDISSPPHQPEPFFQAARVLEIATAGIGFTDVTKQIAAMLNAIGAKDGLLTVFISHTSASLTIQENTDPAVQADLLSALERLAPRDAPYRHSSEGWDDMPAHIKAMLTSVSLSIPVVAGRAALGAWQAIYVVEHRAMPHRRKLTLHFAGARQP